MSTKHYRGLYVWGLVRGFARKLLYSALVAGLVFATAAAACEDETTDDTTNDEEEVVEEVSYSDTLYISEFLPNPSGEESTDEFIEIYNASTVEVDITNWEISDATSRNYTLSGSVGAQQYVTIYRETSGVALNNSGDTVELYQPNGTLLDVVEYTESADDDTAYALDSDGEWYWTTTLTPGRSNTITEITEDSDDVDDASEDTDSDSDSDSDSDETDTTEEDTTEDAEDDSDELQGYDFSDDVVLSEVLPDPEGSDVTDEWIELYNSGSTDIDVYGWQVADPSKTYTISESTTVSAHGYLVLSVIDTSISLNNSGDTVYLYDPAGDLIDEVTYDDADSGYAYARDGDTWDWTATPTPGEANTISDEEDDTVETDTQATTVVAEVETDADTTDRATESTAVIAVAAAKQRSKGDDVIVQGIVNVLPGAFGTQYFYIQDDSGGVQIYSSQKEFPELAIGDVVQVSGKISEADGEVKINTTAVEDIQVVSSGETITAIEVTEYSEDQLGTVVQVTGEVVEKSGSTIILDTGWNVYIKRGTGLSTTLFSEGEHVVVSGVLTATNDGIRVLPRGEADITILTNETNDNQTASLADNLIHSASAKTTTPTDQFDTVKGLVSAGNPIKTYWWVVVIAGVAVFIVGLSRSQKLNTVLRNWCVEQVRALAARCDRWVELEKNATDSKTQNQHHASLPSGKIRS